MSNPRESSLLKTEAYRQQVAEWIFKGILAYQRSQERPEDAARLRLAAMPASQGKMVGTNSSVAQLGEVPDFRPKTNAPSAGFDSQSRQSNLADSEIPSFRPKSSAGTSTSSFSQPSASTPVSHLGPEVRKAQPVEPEVRRAIPVTPRKAE